MSRGWRRVGIGLVWVPMCLVGGGFVTPNSRGAEACTVFALSGKPSPVVGRSLDWEREFPGLMVVNTRGVWKTVLPWKGNAPIEAAEKEMIQGWRSRFGSVSFTAYGRDFIESGMNEAGLVVAQAAAEASYPDADRRAGMSCAQWMQYLLDRYASVDEVREHLGEMRLDGEDWHVLIADAQGRGAVVEFGLDGPVFYPCDHLNPCVITNASYLHALTHLPLDRSFGGEFDIGKADDALGRFVRCAAVVGETWSSPSADRPGNEERALRLLGSVWTDDTIRQVVYEPGTRRLEWNLGGMPAACSVDLTAIDFSYETGCRILRVDDDTRACLSPRPYNGAENLDVARRVLSVVAPAAGKAGAATMIAAHPDGGPLAVAVRELDELAENAPWIGSGYSGDTPLHDRSPDPVNSLLWASDVIFYFSETQAVQPLSLSGLDE